MKSKMGKMLVWLVVVGVLAPLSVSAAARQMKYVMIKMINYNGDGTMSSFYEYEYDENANEIKRTVYGTDGAIVRFYEYKYDENANVIKITTCAADGAVEDYWCYEYDTDGNATKWIGYTSQGSVIYYYEVEYDESGNEKKRTQHNADGTVAMWTDYKYNADGNVVKQMEFDGDGTLKYVYEYKYDEKGEMAGTVSYTYTANGIVQDSESYKSEYDENGNRIKFTHYTEEGSVDYFREYDFDENGNQTKVTQYAADGSIRSVTIAEYALYGNSEGTRFASYEGYDFYESVDGSITCYDSYGENVINEFKCDGTYTYFFQADGTAMTDRLSYHPDGEHVIYFDSNGHEVFSDFANVRKTIAGDSVDDFCFFDVYGYLYVDVVTYDKTGTVLYYANPYGVMERGKWFQFSDTVKCADGTPWEGAAGGYGYANADGTLMKDQWTYDWEGRYCYMQGNGVALYK